MNRVASLFNLLESELVRLGRVSVLRRLRPGLEADAIRRRIDQAGLSSSPALEALYTWKDGVDTSGAILGEIDLTPGFYLLSVEEALATRQAFKVDERWNPIWLPILADGGGDFYVVECDAPGDGKVRRFRIDESQHPIEFSSIHALIQIAVAAYMKGFYFVGQDGYLELQEEQFAALARELDPSVEWWR